MPRVLGGSRGGGRFLMSDVPLYGTLYNVVLQEVEIESIRKLLARAADTGHSN